MEISDFNACGAYLDIQNAENYDDKYCGTFTVKYLRFEDDPYTGDYTEWEKLFLDNGTLWQMHWSVFERENIYVSENDTVSIRRDAQGTYWMEVSTKDKEKIEVAFYKPDVFIGGTTIFLTK